MMFLFAKYYLHHKNESEENVINRLHEHVAKLSDIYIWEMNNDYIKKTVARAKQYDLINIDKITIYESEIEQIRKAKNLTQEKVLFSYLVHAKIKYKIKEETNGWVSNPSKEVFKSVGINYTSKRRDLIEKQLIDTGYFNLSRGVDNNSKQVNYMSLTGKVFCEINNFNQLGEQYEILMGVNEYIKCASCNKLIIKKSNKNKYCVECAYENHKEIKLKYWHNNKKLDK